MHLSEFLSNQFGEQRLVVIIFVALEHLPKLCQDIPIVEEPRRQAAKECLEVVAVLGFFHVLDVRKPCLCETRALALVLVVVKV